MRVLYSVETALRCLFPCLAFEHAGDLQKHGISAWGVRNIIADRLSIAEMTARLVPSCKENDATRSSSRIVLAKVWFGWEEQT